MRSRRTSRRPEHRQVVNGGDCQGGAGGEQGSGVCVLRTNEVCPSRYVEGLTAGIKEAAHLGGPFFVRHPLFCIRHSRCSVTDAVLAVRVKERSHGR